MAGLGYGHESVIVTFTTLTGRTETVLTERLGKTTLPYSEHLKHIH